MINAKNRFKEGWVMLNRPFSFGDIEGTGKVFQKLTIFYAHSERPMLHTVTSEKGIKLINKAIKEANQRKRLTLSDEQRNGIDDQLDEQIEIIKDENRVEEYKGEIIQFPYYDKVIRFFPDEYKVIGMDTLEAVIGDEDSYEVELLDRNKMELPVLKNSIFYLKSRGISNDQAIRMCTHLLTDGVILRPKRSILEMLCREEEIY